MKEDSALGRILVWKVTLSTPHPHASLLWGNGIGYFESQYGKWQADYFREKEGIEKERHIAGYVTTAYNEFLELGLEQGIIVTACIAALWLWQRAPVGKTYQPLNSEPKHPSFP